MRRLFVCFLFGWIALLSPLADPAVEDGAAPPLPPNQAQATRIRPVLAVLPFNDANAKAKEYGYGTTLSAMLVTEMRNHSNFTVLERSKIAEVLGAQNLSTLGVTQKQIHQFEAAYKAEVVLTGDVAYLDGGLEVDARLISTGTGEVAAAASAHSASDKDLRSLVQTLCAAIEKKYLRQWMGSITVASQPVEAEVFLNGDFVGKANPTAVLRLEDLLGGRYRLELLAAGYKSWADTVVVTPKSQLSINASLTALPGNLTINSHPLDAEIFLDGKSMGRTPREIKNVAEGEHQLRVVLQNFNPSEEKVFVNRGQSTQANFPLRIKMGYLDIATLPAGSSVSVNGRYFGKTPLKVDKVDPGKVAVEISSPGYRSFQETYSVKPSDTVIIKDDLKLQTGLLTVVSTPRMVRVRLDDGKSLRELGRAPVIKENLNIGRYKLLLDMDDYYARELPLEIATDEETRVEVRLEQMPGRLSVFSEPHAEILVDGAFRAFSPDQPISLPEGEYAVRLNCYQGTSVAKIAVKANHETTLDHRFPKSQTYLWGALVFAGCLGILIAL